MGDQTFWQVNAWKVAVFGGLLTAFLAIVQALVGTRQRARELRWKRAETGRDLVDALFNEPLSNAALTMLDSDSRIYELEDGTKATITASDMLAALNVPELPQTPLHDFVRDAFDTLYFYLDRMEHFVRVGLTTFEDIRSPLDYYIDYLAEDKALHLSYISITRYQKVTPFLERFSNWESPRQVAAGAPSLGLPPTRRGVGSSSKVPRT